MKTTPYLVIILCLIGIIYTLIITQPNPDYYLELNNESMYIITPDNDTIYNGAVDFKNPNKIEQSLINDNL